MVSYSLLNHGSCYLSVSMVSLESHRVCPLSSSPLRVRPYLMLCSPPHFSSSTPSRRVHPLIEWYPDELICDEGTSRMCQMSRQQQPFWISAIVWNLLGNWVDGINQLLCVGSGVTRNICIHWTCDKENHTVYLTNTKCVDRNNQTWEDANHAFIVTALPKLLDLYLFSFIYEIKTEEFTHQLTNQLIWISLNQGANSTWWGQTRKV